MSTQVASTATNQSTAQILAEIDALRAENQRLQQAQAKHQTVTVKRSKPEGKSAGNALCIYGLGKYPITLYREQALKLVEVIEQVKALAITLPAKAAKSTETGAAGSQQF